MARCTIRRIVCAASVMALLAISSASVAAQTSKVAFETVLKIVAIISAAKTAEQAGISVQEYWKVTVPPGESIYSVEFNFSRSSWGDIWSRPDIFAVVEHEGGNSILIPDIVYNWDYSTKIYTFRCPTLPNGSHCVLRLYDDGTDSDIIWKNILSTKVNWSTSATAQSAILPTRGVECMDVSATANGTISILNPTDKSAFHINAPDVIATARFTVPDAKPSDRWNMQGVFTKSGTEMGKVSLTHWHTNRSDRFLRFVTPSLLFWSTLTIGFVVLISWNPLRTWWQCQMRRKGDRSIY